MNPLTEMHAAVAALWRRRLADAELGLRLDGDDGALSELWRVLQQKRGSRRGGPK